MLGALRDLRAAQGQRGWMLNISWAGLECRGLLGISLECRRAALGLSRERFGGFGGGELVVAFRNVWYLLGGSWDLLGRLGASWGSLGLLGHLSAVMGRLRVLASSPGGSLRQCWGPTGAF